MPAIAETLVSAEWSWDVIQFAFAVFLGSCLPGQSPVGAAPEWTEIKASIVGFEIKEITIQANGMATYSFLECGTFKKQPLRKLVLPKQDLDAFKNVIREAEVYSLPSSVGRLVYSLTPCDIQIKTKKHEKSIRLLCLHDPLPATTIELEQEQRARRVWKAIWDLEPLFAVPKK